MKNTATFCALFALLLTLSLMPNQSKADFVGTSPFDDSVYVFDPSWNVISRMPITLSGFTVLGATAVTWNSDDLLFYAIVRTSTPSRRLVTIVPTTGVCTDIGDMGGNYSSLTYSATTSTMYAMGGAGGGAVAERLYSVNLSTGATSFLGGPYPLGADGEVIAYNYDDGFIYHWSGNSTPNMGKINTSTFVETPIAQSGFSHGEIFGAVYVGGGTFAVTDIASQALTITDAGVVSFVASGLPDDIRGLGYIDPVLPVELASFTSSVNRRNIELNWTTSAETNNSGFEIERQDARSETQEVWSKIGFVQGKGTVNSSSNYSFYDRGLLSGNYNYRLKQIDFNGNFEYFNLSNEVLVGIPASFDLSQNYPNPFNPSTTINYDLPRDGNVSIKLFDISGKEVASIVNEAKTAGYHSINFNAGNLSSGVYFYTITSGNFAQTKKMALVR